MTVKQIREGMQTLGVYRLEYEGTMKTYVSMCNQYNKLMHETRKNDSWYFELTANGTKKSALAATLESLRRDMLTYENALGLTPAGLKKIMDKAPKKSSGGLSRLGRSISGASG